MAAPRRTAEGKDTERKRKKAYARAVTRLVAAHRAELTQLINEERAVEGIPAVGVSPRGRKPKPYVDDDDDKRSLSCGAWLDYDADPYEIVACADPYCRVCRDETGEVLEVIFT